LDAEDEGKEREDAKCNILNVWGWENGNVKLTKTAALWTAWLKCKIHLSLFWTSGNHNKKEHINWKWRYTPVIPASKEEARSISLRKVWENLRLNLKNKMTKIAQMVECLLRMYNSDSSQNEQASDFNRNDALNIENI
jgi:hypothetical protein